MDALLTITDAQGTPRALIENYKGDFAFGSGEQDFELTFDSPLLFGGEFVYIDGTEYGGIVDEVKSTSNLKATTYKGRTWHGILTDKVLEPDAGQDYLRAQGDAQNVLTRLIKRISLDKLFVVDVCDPVHIDYQFKRYVDAYTGIKDMLAASGAKLTMAHIDAYVHICAQKVATIGNEVDTDIMQFSVTKAVRPINHLVCLGKGELKDRQVLHLYADEHGNISRTKTFYGSAERSQTYDASSAEPEELAKNGTKKLKELQQQGGVDANLARVENWWVGDIIEARDTRTGIIVQAPIKKKIARIKDGVLKVQYEIGTAAKKEDAPEAEKPVPASDGTGSSEAQAATKKAEAAQATAQAADKKADEAKAETKKTKASADQAQHRADEAYQKADDAYERAQDAKSRADDAYRLATSTTTPYERTYSENGERLRTNRWGKVVTGTIDGWTVDLPNSRSTYTITTLPSDLRPAFDIEAVVVGKNSYAELACWIKTSGEIIVWSLGSGTLGKQQIYGNFSFITQ